MRIRRATPADLPGLVAINRTGRRDAAKKRLLHNAIKSRTVYVLTGDGPPVAYGILAPSFFMRPFIEMLYVAPDQRGKGHGSRFLAYLTDHGLRTGEVWASTNRSNKAIRSLLKKEGFIFKGQVSGLDEGDPELFYRKKKP